MLQIFIEHSGETVCVQKICNDITTLAEMQDGKIDLDVCIPYVDREINVHHTFLDNSENDYVLAAKLEKVEIEPTTNIKCIRYSPTGKTFK